MAKLKICCPADCAPERKYAIDLTFNWFFGLDYDLEPEETDCYTILFDGRKLEIPDIFFPLASKNWLSPGSVPTENDLKYIHFELNGEHHSIASWFHCETHSPPGQQVPLIQSNHPDCTRLSSDLIGNLFFLITRYEENCSDSTDKHGRFRLENSVLRQDKLYLRPLVNEYLEILGLLLNYFDPSIKIKSHQYEQVITCDLDYLRFPPQSTIGRKFLYFASSVRKTHSLRTAVPGLFSMLRSLVNGYRHDRYNRFEVLIRRCREMDSRFILYLMQNEKGSAMDGDYRLNSRVLFDTVKMVASYDKTDFGLHGSYDSYIDFSRLFSQKQAIENYLDGHGVMPPLKHSRQHYLRWKNRVTPSALSKAGFQTDSSLAFAETSGFRSSTCLPYPIFDLENRKTLSLIEIPLVLMDGSLTNPNYLGYSNANDALDYAWSIKDQCIRHNGQFTLLWHNSSLSTPLEKEIFLGLTADHR